MKTNDKTATASTAQSVDTAKQITWADAQRYANAVGTSRRAYDICHPDGLVSLADAIAYGEEIGGAVADWLPKTTLKKIATFAA